MVENWSEGVIMNTKDIINALFGFILTVLGVLILKTFTGIKDDLKETEIKFSKSINTLSKSVTSLNSHIVEVTTNQTWVTKEINKIEIRQHELELRILDIEKKTR